MIPAVVQTLARILADGTSLSNTEQIDFNPPSPELMGRSVLTVYCYNIQERCPSLPKPLTLQSSAPASVHPDQNLRWFELSFLVTAWDHTVLGEHQLLSEALISLLRHQYQQEAGLVPELLGCERTSFDLSAQPAIDPVMLWRSLRLPLRPALYLTVTVPLLLPNI